MTSLRWLLTGRYEQAKFYRFEAGHRGNFSSLLCLKASLPATGACLYEPLATQESLSKALPATRPSLSAQTVERHTVVSSQVSAKDTDGSGASLCQWFSVGQPYPRSLGAEEGALGVTMTGGSSP